MKFIFSGRNVEITESLKEKAISKISKLEKFLNEDTEIHITMSVQKNRQIVDVTMHYNGILIRAEESEADMYTAIDKIVDILKRKISDYKDYRTRKIKKHSEAQIKTIDSDVAKHEDNTSANKYKLIKSKSFPLKPMDVEEAIMQLDLLGHDFFVFINVETKQVNVMYKRNDGYYGLIEPEY